MILVGGGATDLIAFDFAAGKEYQYPIEDGPEPRFFADFFDANGNPLPGKAYWDTRLIGAVAIRTFR
jgi:hypothetical protein